MVNKTILGLSLVLCVASSAHADFTVAMNGQSTVTIVIPDRPTEIETSSSADLQRCIRRITGVRLPIVAEAKRPKTPCIDIGATARGLSWRKKLRGQKGISDEAATIDVTEHGIVLVGRNDAATGHAVYTLLQKTGVRWLQPSLLWEIVPQKKTLALPIRTATVSPFFDRRGGLHYSAKAMDDTWSNSLAAFGRRNRTGGWDHIGSGHSYNYIVPRDLLKKHPEYFALWQGSRQTRQLCTTNPQVIKRAIAIATDWCKKSTNRLLCISPNDGNYGFCECKNCSKLRFAKGNHSDLILELANEVARAIRKKHPERYVTFYADYHCVGTPIKVRPEKNVLFWIPQWNVDRFQPITHPRQKRFRTAIQQWSKYGNPIHIYLYTGSYNHWMHYPLAHCFKVDFPYFARNGVRGVYSQTSQHWGTQGLNFYLYSRLAWNPLLDVDELIDEFCELAFGPAAKTMGQYYRLLDSTAGKGSHYTRGDIVRVFSPKVVAQADKLMSMAVKQVQAKSQPGDPTRKRVEYVAEAQRLVSLNLRAKHAMLEFFRTRNRKLLDLVEQNYKAEIKILQKHPNSYLIDGDYVRRLRRDLAVLSEKMEYGPGNFVYRDSLAGGGNAAIHARSLTGFHTGQWGLNLYSGAEGRALYRFSTKKGATFKKVILDDARFAYAKGQLSNSISIRTPRTNNKFVPLVQNRDLESYRVEIDLTKHVQGLKWFEIRFSARNGDKLARLSLIRFTVKGTVAKDGQ